MWWKRKSQVTVTSSVGFRKGDVLLINDGEGGTYMVADITSDTLTIKPFRWWNRLWKWLCQQWPF